MRDEKDTFATRHAGKRANERVNIKNPRELQRMISLAFLRGKRTGDLRRSGDRECLSNHCNDAAEAVAYNGICFIFSKENGACITLYRLPNEFGRKFTKHGDVWQSENLDFCA